MNKQCLIGIGALLLSAFFIAQSTDIKLSLPVFNAPPQKDSKAPELKLSNKSKARANEYWTKNRIIGAHPLYAICDGISSSATTKLEFHERKPSSAITNTFEIKK